MKNLFFLIIKGTIESDKINQIFKKNELFTIAASCEPRDVVLLLNQLAEGGLLKTII